ncbi:hypothetical protein LSH36_680g03040 [Paralvinella palmiformis]|uniref:Sulfurtransferase n=1 Tax=Paralvinella palmiformis TaxID=53620 RepID=A0AAD9J3L2_9ANNE|nr:hypothetical protein LSH36_680g03040 [Paralvinella palmiformis]
MAWKGNILKVKELRNCVSIFQNNVPTSNIIAVNVNHIKTSVRTWATVCPRRFPTICVSQLNRATRTKGLNVTGCGSYQSIISSYGTEQSTESGEVIEKKSQARTEVSYEELKTLINKPEVLIIDVREPKEIEQTGMMPGAINIPITKLKSSLALDKEDFKAQYKSTKPASTGDNLVFYGLSNVRSEAALELAHKAGFKNLLGHPALKVNPVIYLFFLPISEVGLVEIALSCSRQQFCAEFGVEKPSCSDQIVFTCMRGIRSNTAVCITQNLGYERAKHYPGGWQEWSEKETGS